MQPSAPAVDGVFVPHRRGLTIGILLAVAVFTAEGMGVVPALPTAVRALGAMPLFGWAFSAFMLAWIVGTIAAGQLADRVGPLRPTALGLMGFGLGLIFAASAQGIGQFLVGRALQGAGGGAMVAAVYVAVARGYPDALRARMMALTASVWVLPSVLFPSLSGAIVQRWGWRMVFACVVPLVALSAVLVLRPLRELSLAAGPPAHPSRVPAAVRLALGAALVLAAPSFRAHGSVVTTLVVVCGVGILLPALLQLLPVGTLRARRGLPMGIALRGFLALSFFGAEAFVPLGASVLRGATPTQGGLALTTASLGWISMSWLQERLELRSGATGRAFRLRVGFVIVAIGIGVVMLTLLTHLPLVMVAVGWGIGGAGIGIAYSAGSLLCLAAAPQGGEGEVSGQLQMAEALGTASGAGLGGALLDLLRERHCAAGVAHGAVFGLCILVALTGAVLSGRAE